MIDQKARETGDLSDFDLVVPENIVPGDRFTKVTPEHRDFSNLDLRGVRFYYSDLRWCTFENSNLEGAHICWCYTDGSLFRRVNGHNITHRSTKSRECVFDESDFENTDFHHSRFNRSQFIECDLVNTCWQMTEIDDTFYVDCDLLSADFRDSDIAMTNLHKYVMFDSMELAGSNLDVDL